MKEVISNLMNRGYLVSPEFLKEIDEFFDEETFLQNLNKKLKSDSKPLVLNGDLLNIFQKIDKISSINWLEFEKSKAGLEKGRNGKVYTTFLDLLQYNSSTDKKDQIDRIVKEIKKPQEEPAETEYEPSSNVIVLESHKEDAKKREIQDFVSYFKNRYHSLSSILQGRMELQNTISINRLSGKNRGDKISIIGVVVDKKITKNGNISMTVEDPTGIVNVLINKDKMDLFSLGSNTVHDEVIGISGVYGQNIIFANDLIVPDIPMNKELKKAKEDIYAVFISDIHVGSNMFLEADFKKFINWLNGNHGNSEQKKVAKKIKYLMILGDLVDGIGIYPEQDKELTIKDITQQYNKCAEYLSEIRDDIHIIVAPGNHDALRIAEPQPILNADFAKAIYDIKNVTMVSNPAMVNIHSSKDFPGFDILMYHGYSFDYYVNNVDTIRLNGGYDRADLIMKFLLQKRHLAPSHGSTLYIPETKLDPLTIRKIPDFFVSGHIHKANIGAYNNVTTICCSCWQSKTAFQEKVGHSPEPSRVPIVNLRTREVKMLKFCD